jgi:hypothetical protein
VEREDLAVIKRRGPAVANVPSVLLGRSDVDLAQQDADRWYGGGKPRLPPDAEVPMCRVCGEEMTLFLYTSAPPVGRWIGRAINLFACTAHADPGVVPDAWPSSGAAVGDRIALPPGYLEDYQTFFRIVVADADASTVLTTYRPRLRFQRLAPVAPGDQWLLRVGGTPGMPASETVRRATSGSADDLDFLLRVRAGLRFPVEPGAPPQARLYPDVVARADRGPEYDLFGGAPLWLFGDHSARFVWVVAGDPDG